MDAHGKASFPFFSTTSRHLLGINPNDQCDEEIALFKSVHPDDKPAFTASIQESAANLSTWNSVFRFVLPNGKLKWFKGEANPIRDNEGNTIWNGLLYDIDQLKKTEVFLQETTKLAKVGYWEVDLIHQTLTWSAMTHEIHEVDESYKPDLASAIEFYKDGYYRETIRNAVDKAIEKAESFDIELMLITAKGNEKWVRSVGSTETFQGKVVRLFGVFQDIDVEKRNIIRLKEKTDELQNILDSSLDVICTVNANGEFSSVSSSCFENWGYTVDELLGRKYIDFIIEEDREETNLAAAELMKDDGLVRNFHNRYRHKDGSIVLNSWNVSWNHAEQRMYCIGRNINDIVKANETIEEYNDQIELIVNSITDGFYTLNSDWVITYVNKNALELLRLGELNPVGMNIWDLFADAKPYFKPYLDEAMNNRVPTTFEVYYEPFNDWCELRVYPAKGGITVFLRDVTAKKNAEKERELLIAELSKTNHELKQFSFIASHNLRAPVTTLKGLCSLLETITTDDDYLKSVLQGIAVTTDTMMHTLDDLISILVIKNKVLTEMSEIDVEKIFFEVLDRIPSDIIDHDFQLIQHLRVVAVYANKTYFEQVFYYLLTNAFAFRSKERGLTIELSSEESENEIHIHLSDNGSGFDTDKYKDRVFGLYQRFHNSGTGKGLGLFMAKTLVEAMGGKIFLRSEVSKGTRVSIALPKK
jgi:PAS domain S-box-containing protein